MSATNSLHYELCIQGALWLRSRCHCEKWQNPWRYIWVEAGLVGENPDIFAYNGDRTLIVEVKTSHQDFLNDRKKPWRRPEYRNKMGMYRYYLAPKGIIQPSELPDGWGLLEWDGTLTRGRFNITKTVQCPSVHNPTEGDLHAIGSLLRRENLRQGIYNYRGLPTTIHPKT